MPVSQPTGGGTSAAQYIDYLTQWLRQGGAQGVTRDAVAAMYAELVQNYELAGVATTDTGGLTNTFLGAFNTAWNMGYAGPADLPAGWTGGQLAPPSGPGTGLPGGLPGGLPSFPGSSGGTVYGSSSGSSSAGPTGPTPEQLATLRAQFEMQIQDLGLNPTDNLDKLVDAAVKGFYSSTQFLQALRKLSLIHISEPTRHRP
jgi:hypothetical protein